ncbi:MAG: class I poly(R)-hydroxyalkanoic acid synthase [Burkholderiaceae bacterium]
MATPTPSPSAAPGADAGLWMNQLLQAQQALWQPYLTPPPLEPLGTASDPASWTQATQALVDWQQQGWQQWASLWLGALTGATFAGFGGPAATAPADRRFAGEAWQQDPRFDAISRTYLQQSQAMRDALKAAPLPERNKAQWDFVLRQVLDAASPANCLLLNPVALKTAVDSGGASLVDGMRLFLEDFARGRVSMTDDTAFEVGRNVATTPGSVVFQNELIQLIQYAPTTARVHKRPLVVVPPCINKFYILDLQPENSLVAYAASQGHTVFLVSWRNIGPEQGHLGWDDYVETGVMRALDVAREITRADKVNALGFCIGGTLLSSALAVLAQRDDASRGKVASLTLLTTMLDFSDTGELGLLVDERSTAQRESTIGQGGVLRGAELAQVFAALRANDLIWPYVVNGYLQGKAPPAFDLLFWNGDDSNLPGPMFCWYLRNTYLENKLRQPGATLQCGVPVDLSTIGLPSFVYASREDHIVPWRTAYASTGILGGDTTFVLGASGHIAGVINPPAKGKRSHWVGASGPGEITQAQAWFDAAEEVPGSWWPRWSEWLGRHAGPEVAAPKSPGNAAHPAIEPAPGSFVRAKAP